MVSYLVQCWGTASRAHLTGEEMWRVFCIWVQLRNSLMLASFISPNAIYSYLILLKNALESPTETQVNLQHFLLRKNKCLFALFQSFALLFLWQSIASRSAGKSSTGHRQKISLCSRSGEEIEKMCLSWKESCTQWPSFLYCEAGPSLKGFAAWTSLLLQLPYLLLYEKLMST